MSLDPGALPIAAPRLSWARAADFLELTKPKLVALVLFTVFAGFYVASPDVIDCALLLHTMTGTALMAAGAGALNMYRERVRDALMRRTALRPLAAGRLQAGPALGFALFLSIAGFFCIEALVNHLTALLAMGVFVSYLFLYTPLKTRTWLCTVVGAIPGALPIVMGWTAAAGDLSADAWALFLIVFLWQIPHFYAIGWMHRDDYRRAGIPVLSVVDPSGARSGRQVLLALVALIVCSLFPTFIGLSSRGYLTGAIALGALFLCCGIAFARRRDRTSAHRLFLVSALYLPTLLVLLVLDRALGR